MKNTLVSRQIQLASQGFEGNPLDRSVLVNGRLECTATPNNSRLLPCVGRKVFCESGAKLKWVSLAAWQEAAQEAPMYVLGKASDDSLCYALDLTEAQPLSDAASAVLEGSELVDMRRVLSLASSADLAVAGHAVALCSWHLNHRFCSVCGAPSEPSVHGMKRICTADPKHRHYPRTDPVIIVLVESCDGSKALLGQSLKHPDGLRTCLSGFVDQCESIEEAVRREVQEEAGVGVDEVQIVGSQPWPIGRGGSCELMIGAIAAAKCDDIHLDPNEMKAVAWFSRDELTQALEGARQRHAAGEPPFAGVGEGMAYYLPPPTTIAYSLIHSWVQSGDRARL